jgi:hypothetical protein
MAWGVALTVELGIMWSGQTFGKLAANPAGESTLQDLAKCVVKRASQVPKNAASL